MNKQQAYSSFWRSFGVLAFEENSMPDDEVVAALIKSGAAQSKYPYITYQVLVDDMGHVVNPTASIYDRSSSWERVDTLANAISGRIQAMNTIALDNGRMYITKGSPFAQHFGDEGESTIKRVVLNLSIEFLTEI